VAKGDHQSKWWRAIMAAAGRTKKEEVNVQQAKKLARYFTLYMNSRDGCCEINSSSMSVARERQTEQRHLRAAFGFLSSFILGSNKSDDEEDLCLV
jgi:hypothetical protein